MTIDELNNAGKVIKDVLIDFARWLQDKCTAGNNFYDFNGKIYYTDSAIDMENLLEEYFESLNNE